MTAPTPSHRSVLVVILSFNGSADTIECLASLARQTYRNMAVVVVDNASTDGAPEAIRARFPEIELVASATNLGWAGGNNIGIRLGLERGYDLICLLNNDTVLEPDAIGMLADAATATGPCLIHPAIYCYSDPRVAQLDPPPTQSPPERAIRMDHAYGACLMIDAGTLRKIGLIDERFFLQLEETDLYYRAQRAGIGSFCAPQARILHKESPAFGGKRAPVKTYYSIRNSLLLMEKHFAVCHPVTMLKQMYWSMHRLSETQGPVAFARWCFSPNLSAVAFRRGIKDYLFRRFGRMRT